MKTRLRHVVAPSNMIHTSATARWQCLSQKCVYLVNVVFARMVSVRRAERHVRISAPVIYFCNRAGLMLPTNPAFILELVCTMQCRLVQQKIKSSQKLTLTETMRQNDLIAWHLIQSVIPGVSDHNCAKVKVISRQYVEAGDKREDETDPSYDIPS